MPRIVVEVKVTPEQRPLCSHCGARIRDFKVRRDWDGRRMHKKCFIADMNRRDDSYSN